MKKMASINCQKLTPLTRVVELRLWEKRKSSSSRKVGSRKSYFQNDRRWSIFFIEKHPSEKMAENGRKMALVTRVEEILAREKRKTFSSDHYGPRNVWVWS